MKLSDEVRRNPEIRHSTGHTQALTDEELAAYEKDPSKFALDERAQDADGKPTQVLHCHGLNQLRPLHEFTFVANGENLDPNYETEEVEEEVEEEVDGKKQKSKRKVRRRKAR